MQNKKTIFNQILWRTHALMLIFFILSFISLKINQDQNETKMRDYILADHVRTLATFLKVEDTGPNKGKTVFDIPAATKKFYDDPFDYQGETLDYQYVIRDAAGKVLFSDKGTDASKFPAKWPTTSEPSFFEFDDAQFGHRFGSEYTQHVGNNIYLVQTAVNKSAAYSFPRSLISTLLARMLVKYVLLYVFFLAVLYWTLGQSLQGLKKISDAVSKISISYPGYRIDETDLPEEVHNVVVTLNQTLDRLESGIKFERDFIANAAHELRTPLSIIRCRAEEVNDKAVAHPLLKDIDSLSHLIQQLLDKAKISGLQLNNFQRIDLKDVTQKVCADIGPLLIREKREIEVISTNKPMIVLGEEWAIGRSLANLIENAINHTPKGKGIEISLKDFSISVRDNGPGIPPENHKKIFQSFWRQDDSNPCGSGLGLTIVKRIMELHHGTVDVENATDGGAIFTLRFPEAAAVT